MEIFIPELAGLPGMGQFCRYNKVWSFILILSMEWHLPALGCGWGYNKDQPCTCLLCNTHHANDTPGMVPATWYHQRNTNSTCFCLPSLGPKMLQVHVVQSSTFACGLTWVTQNYTSYDVLITKWTTNRILRIIPQANTCEMLENDMFIIVKWW